MAEATIYFSKKPIAHKNIIYKNILVTIDQTSAIDADEAMRVGQLNCVVPGNSNLIFITRLLFLAREQVEQAKPCTNLCIRCNHAQTCVFCFHRLVNLPIFFFFLVEIYKNH